MHRAVDSWIPRHGWRSVCLVAVGLIVAAQASSSAQSASGPAVTVSPNVNVLRNISDPLLGDANLQRQTEPVVAISTRNPDHIMVAANDYRTVDIATDQGIGQIFAQAIRTISRTAERLWAKVTGRSDGFGEAEEEERERAEAGTEAWVGVYVTNDRGRNWTNAWMPGYPQDTSAAGKGSPAYGRQAASDPVLVSAPAGRFYLGAMAFDRGGTSKIVVSRFTDRNNSEKGSNFHFDLMRAVDAGSTGKQFLDKPSIIADVARAVPDASACGPVYIGYTVFDANVTNPSDRSRIYIATSLDCGNTWLAPRKVNRQSKLVQGVSLAIRPSDGRLYAAYRDFEANRIYVTWADDRGYTFAPPIDITGPMLAFDQPTLGAPDYAFRSNAFPTIAVKGDNTVYAAWQERLIANGNPRIVITSSTNGSAWARKKAVEPDRCIKNANGATTCNVEAGPQVMPSLTFSRGLVMLAFYEARPGIDNVKFVASQNASYITGLDVQLYLRVAQLDATGKGTSAIATQFDVDKDGKPIPLITTEGATEYRGANRPNLPMYAGGKSPFIGDYLSIAPSMPFVRTAPNTTSAAAAAKGGSKSITPYWRWATESNDGPTASFQTVWTDNRDVIFPRNAAGLPRIDGDWSQYAPPGFGPCINPGSRNANVYTAEIAPRLVAGTPTSFKQFGIQRAFVIYLQNRTADRKFFRMTIVDTADANGSFVQRGQDVNVRDVEIFPLSTVTDSVYVTGGTSASQPVRVDIVEIDKQGGVAIPGGDTASVVFNSDNSNPPLETDTPTSETHTPKLFTPGNRGSSLPKISNPQLANPQLANPQLANPQLANPQLANPQLANLQLTNSPYADPTGDVVQNVTNYTWQFTNAGNTASAFTPVFNIANQAALAGKKTRLTIYNTYKTPAFIQTPNGCRAVEQPRDVIISVIENPQLANPQLANPQLANPQLANPQLANSTFYVAPSDNVSSTGTAAVQGNRLQNVAFQAAAGDADLTIAIPPPDTFITLTIQDGDTFRVGPPPPPPAPGEPPPASNPPLTLDDFTGGNAALGVVSEAAPVINGVVQPIVESVSTSADLVFSSIPTITPPSLQAGGLVTISSFNVTVVGNTSTAASGFRYGFYLSPTLEINPSTAVFLGNLTYEGAIAPGQIVPLSGGTFAIPPTTTPGQYYVGVFLNDGQQYTPALTPFLFESFANNTASLALTIAAPVGPAPTSTSDLGSTNEDTTLNVAAPGVLGNDGNAGPVTAVLSLGASHGTVTLNPNGSYSYVPAGNYFGPDSFTYYATNGTLASPLATVAITVQPVNDAPSFVRGADQNVPADTAVTVPGWASSISAGAANEQGQLLTFIVTPDNAALFATPAIIDPTNGTLSFTSGHVAGSTTVHVRIHDSGGTAPGVDTSAEQTFAVTVQPPPGPSANLQISQVHAPLNVTVGDNVTYTVTVSNLGPDAADAVVVTDLYPTGLVFVSTTPSVGSCSTGANGIQCSLGTMASGASATIAMVYSAVSGGPVTHAVSTSSTANDPLPANNAASDLTVAVFPSCTSAEFKGPYFTNVTGFSSGILAVADFNKDGLPDIVVTLGQSANEVVIVFGGDPTPVHVAVGANPSSVSTADFNKDGNPDLVVVNGDSASVTILLGNGAGGFAPATYNVPAGAFSSDVGDFNGDGFPDLVLGYGATTATSVAVLLNNGSGGFGAVTTYASGQSPINVLVADFDGDGTLDIAVPNSGTTNIAILKGTGTGSFIPPGTPGGIPFIPLPATVQRLRYLGDINKDGRPDLGATTGTPSNLYLLLNQGAGTFGPPSEIIPPLGLGFSIPGDFNKDGNLDIATLNPGGGRIIVLLGDGTGAFPTSASYATASNMNHLAVADLDGDGRLDIIGTSLGAIYTLMNTCGTPQQSDLTVTASAPANVVNGSTFSVSANVTNHGPGFATDVRVTYAIPPGLSFVGASGSGTCTTLNGTVSCDVGTLNAGLSADFTFDVQAYAAGARTSAVGATSSTTELAPADNFAQAVTTVAAGPQTFTVTTTANIGPGSLRQAITDSNTNTGSTNTITFNISGGGPQTIALASGLPSITVPVVINGGSQPGYAGTPLITIDGGNTILEGLQINASGAGSIIRGLVVTHFQDGVFANGASNSTIVSNTLTANGFGVFIGGSASNVKVGGIIAGEGNTIVGNGGAGVRIASGTGNAVRQNSISGNGLLGIDLDATGVTANDAGDADTGANNLQNFPVLDVAQVVDGVTTIAGTLNSAANGSYSVELFSNASCDVTGNGEGELYLGTLTVGTDLTGNASFSTTNFSLPGGRYITATATDVAGNTSEFSACRQIVAGIVTTDLFVGTIPPGETGSGFVGLDAHHDGGPVPTTLSTVRFSPSGKTNLSFPGPMAILPATLTEPGLGYFLAAGGVGVFDLASGQVSDVIPMQSGPTLIKANTTTRFLYIVSGNRVFAIDARSGSPTHNQIVLSTTIGSAIRSIQFDESRGRLYVLGNSTGTNTTAFTSQLAILDVSPASPTFHQVIGATFVSSNVVNDAAVNPTTNKIYVADGGGLRVVDGATLAVSTVANVPGSLASVAVNPTKNMIYVSNGFVTITAVKGADDTRVTAFSLPTSGGPSVIGEGRLVIHNSSGRVFYRYDDGPKSSSLAVIDGDPVSATFNQVVTRIPAGWETAAGFISIDQTAGRLAVHTEGTRSTMVIDAATNGVIATIGAPQRTSLIPVIDPSTHVAYLCLTGGAIQTIDLTTGNAQLVHTGTQMRAPIIDKAAHLVYVPRVGVDTGVAVINSTGLVTTITPPAGAGDIRWIQRAASTNRIYATNFMSDPIGTGDAALGSVAVINANTRTVEANITVGNRPGGVAVDDVLNKVYVGNTSVTNDVSANYQTWAGITVITFTAQASPPAPPDTYTYTTAPANMGAIAAGPVAINPQLTVNPVTHRVYFRILSGATTTIGYLDGATNAAFPLPASLGPVSTIRVNPTLNRVYVGATDGKVHILDGTTHAELATIPYGSATNTSGNIQNWIAVNQTTGKVYIGDNNADALVIVNGQTNAIENTINNLEGVLAVAVNETTNRVYVAQGGGDPIVVVDGATQRIVGAIPVALSHPIAMVVDDTVTPAQIFVAADCSLGSSCLDDPGVFVVTDPIDPDGPLTLTSVSQPGHGSVVVNADGSLTLTTNGNYTGPDSFTYTVTDSRGGSGTGTITYNVTAPPTLTTTSLPSATVGQPYSQPLTASGGTAPYTFKVINGQLPAGFALNETTGTIAGVATNSGTYSVTITVTDTNFNEDTKTYSMIVGPIAIITSLNNATVNTLFSQQLFAGGNTGSVTWSLNVQNSPLLTWLTLSASGVLSGTPPAYGTTPTFIVTAVDSDDPTHPASRAYTLTVGGPLDITPTTLREGVVLETGQPALPLVGGTGNRTVTVVSGSLPPGVTLTSNGAFTGAPATHGTFVFDVKVTDSASPPVSVTRTITWRVSAREQQGSTQTQSSISFGGPSGRKIAQTFTMAAAGKLTGVGSFSLSCSLQGPVTVEIQRLTLGGVPDGTAIASGLAINNFSAISVNPPIDVAIDERLAFVWSSPTSCDIANAPTNDTGYQSGDAYANVGGVWNTLASTDGRYDIPFRTLIQPAVNVAYFHAGRFDGAAASPLAGGTKVLVTGTDNTGDVYDEGTNATTQTPVLNTPSASPFNTQRFSHTSTLLDDGTVLIAGGRNSTGNSTYLTSAETYNPATNTYSLAGSMSVGRQTAAAVKLPNGKVLIVGGFDGAQNSASAELYDPGTRTFSSAGSMTTGRNWPTVVLLNSGKVLIAGGFVSSVNGGATRSAEIYDPANGSFTATTGSMAFLRGRATGTLLNDGRVLVAGGQIADVRAEAEIYDPTTDSFTTTATPMTSKRFAHAATALPDGTVLVSGGYDSQNVNGYILPLATLERYLPSTNSFVAAGSMEVRRAAHSSVALADGKVLLVGGTSANGWFIGDTGELYDVTKVPSLTTTLPDGQVGNAYPNTVLTASGGQGGPYTIALVYGVLPNNMNYAQATATLSGTPTVTGTFPLGFRVTDSAGNANVQTLTLKVGNVPTFTSTYRLTDGAVGAFYFLPLAATGAAPLTFSLPSGQSLPAGLSISPSGVISGTPTALGFFNFVIRLVDGTGQSVYKSFAISINNPLTITTSALPELAVLETTSGCINSSNGFGTRTWSLTTVTPATGLSILSNGCLSPTAIGTYSFTAQVTDNSSPSQTATRSFVGVRVSAREQQAFTTTGSVTAFGSGRRLAQTITIGANGTLRGVGFNSSTSCAAGSSVTVEVQRLTVDGRPDGTTLTSGTTSGSLAGIAVSPGLPVAIDQKYALVLSATVACTTQNNSTNDYYQAGDAFADSGSGWTPLINTDGRYDFPVRTLIQPSVPLTYLNASRNGAVVALLNSGKVLIAGGGTAELYDQATAVATPTGNPIFSVFSAASAVLGDGTVLIAGGNINGTRISAAMTYDPAAGTFAATSNNLSVARDSATAVTLGNGNVLIVGGNDSFNSSVAADVYNPATRTFTAVPNMLSGHNSPTATLLDSGKVLIAGGYTFGANAAELYDPLAGPNGSFTATTGNMVVFGRGRAAAAKLIDGRVLITGGQAGDVVNSAEVYDPTTDTFSAAGNMSSRRYLHTASVLNDGSVLIAGGDDAQSFGQYTLPLASMERYIPGSNSFVPAGSMAVRRQSHGAVRLLSNKVLFVGGDSQSWLTNNSAELYDITTTPALSPNTLPDGQVGVAYPNVMLSASGGGGAPYTINQIGGGLPPGMGYDPSTKLLSGTPTAAGQFTANFTVTSTLGDTNSQSLTIRVGNLLTITNPYRLVDGAFGHAYSLQLQTANAIAPVVWSFASNSALPTNLSLSPSGLISGTINTNGYFNFAVRATDASGASVVKVLSINVLNPLVITTASLPEAVLWDGVNRCIATSSWVGTRTFTVLSGSLPAGLSLDGNSGCFGGTFSALGTSNFTIQVTDTASPPQINSLAYSVRVSAPDASFSIGSGTNPQSLGQTTQRSVARTFTTGFSGLMTAAQAFGLACSNNPVVQMTTRLYRASPLTGEPLSLLATGTGDWFDPIKFGTPVTVGLGEQYVVEFLIPSTDCTIATPTTQTWMPGDAWQKIGNAAWQRMVGLDVPFRVVTVPLAPFSSLSTWRGGIAAALTSSGRILIAGGSPNLASAELYDPATGTLTPTGNMTVSRYTHVATSLAGGKVLITGGSDSNGNARATAEVFNPALGTNGTFTATGNTMSAARQFHTATVLSDGRVLIVGGFNSGGGVASVDIYDPVTNLFTAVAPMGASRWAHTATLLPGDTRVLIVGGNSNGPFPVPNGVIYDPATNAYTSTSEPIVALRSRHVAIPLTAGRVLIAGGTRFYPGLEPVAQIYNPITNSLETGPTMIVPRMDPTVVGDLIFGGIASDAFGQWGLSEVERYNAATNQFESSGDLMVKRYQHAAASIGGGRSVLIGGYGASVLPGRTLEVYGPTPVPALRPSLAPNGQNGQAYGPFTANTSGTSPFTLSIYSNLMPDGVGIAFNMAGSNALGFTLSGTSTAAGSFPFNVLVGDGLGAQRTQAFRVRIDPIIVTTSQLPQGTNGVSYNQQIQATSLHGPLTFTIVTNNGAEVTTGGGLPNGLSLSSGGAVNGIPTQSGFFTFNVRVTDQLKQSVLTLVSIFIP